MVMKVFKIYFLTGLIIFLMIPLLVRASVNGLLGVELDSDDSNKSLVLFDNSGKKVEIDNFTELITKNISSDGQMKSVISYLADLNQDGKFEIISLVRFDGAKNKVFILDETGKLLDSEDSGYGDNLVFGLEKKGFPFFWGYETEWGLAAGAAEWEFDYWNGSKIINAISTVEWIGKGGPGTEPHFVYLPEQDALEIVSDEGKKLWDKNEMRFMGYWKPLDEKELLEGCSDPDESLDHLARGKKYFHQHEYNCAVQEYKLDLQDHPSDYSAWQYLGYAYLRAGASNAAKNALEKAVQINPDYIMGHYNLALADFAEFDEQGAVSEIGKVIKLNPAYEKTINSDPQFKSILQSKTYLTWESQQKK